MVESRSFFAALLCAIAIALCGCGQGEERIVLRGATMGTTWSVIYGASSTDRGELPERAQIQAQIEAELLAINNSLSTYIPDSEISRLNDASDNASVTLSPLFAEVLEASLAVSEKTAGAYDVTVGPLVELWGFGSAEFSGALPSADAIEEARARVGLSRLRWEPEKRRLSRPAGLRIDLSSIAKGYAVDRLTDLLQDLGIRSALIEIGGELRAVGDRPEGGQWRLAIESPDPAEGRVIDALSLTDAAVATSGDYRNYFELDGKRYSHLVDPRTGYPVTHELVSVTVVDTQCMLADAWATALIVLGLDEARRLAEELGLATYFISRGDDGLEVHYSSGFAAYRPQDAIDT